MPIAVLLLVGIVVQVEQCERDPPSRVRQPRQQNSAVEHAADAIGAQPQTHYDGCGGRAGKAELLPGIEDANSRPVRRIVLWG
jgi:hypothetical protein